MDWTEIKSSMMKAYRFLPETVNDGVTFGRLEIEWANGSKGAYLDVNQRTYDDLMTAPSAGKYLNSVIKPNFRYVRQEPEDAETGEEGAQEPAGEPKGSEGQKGHPKA